MMQSLIAITSAWMSGWLRIPEKGKVITMSLMIFSCKMSEKCHVQN